MPYLHHRIVGFSALLGALALAACNGASGGSFVGVPAPSQGLAPAHTTAPCVTQACIYVTTWYQAKTAVDAFAATANGNVAPLADIAGQKAHLYQPQGVAVDSAHDIYVASAQNPRGGGDTITVYGPRADGNTRAIRAIAGTNTGLVNPQKIALDAAGNLYVTDNWEQPSNSAITVYAAGANGNVAPIQNISGLNTLLVRPVGIALDASNDVYVADPGSVFSPASISVFAAGATGNVAPIRRITGTDTGLHSPFGIALDADGTMYACNQSPASITVYPAGSNGDATPRSSISGSRTKLESPQDIAVDSSGTIYVANTSSGKLSSVTVYAPGAHGNAKPVAIIRGSASKLKVFAGAIAVR